MMALTPYPGHDGRYFSMPARNVLPKPVQKPHPPMWMACSDDDSARLAARLGVGALIHTFFDADEAAHVVEEYYRVFREECVPIGHTVNPAVATLEPFYCHESAQVAHDVGRAAHGFFTYAVRHFYVYGRHRPGFTDLSRNVADVRAALEDDIPIRGGHSIGTPETITTRLEALAGAGVDQTILLHAAGNLTHQQVTRSMQLFADEVMPRLDVGRRDRRERRAAELQPSVRAALARRSDVAAPSRDDVAVVDAYGLTRPDLEMAMIEDLPPATREIILDLQRLKAIATGLDA